RVWALLHPRAGRGSDGTRPRTQLSAIRRLRRGELTWRSRGRSVRVAPQLDTSLNPRPLRIIGTHFSARAALVFACFADETWKIYDFLRPGVSASNADLITQFSSSLLCNSSGIGYSDTFLSSTLFPDSSNSMAS